MKRKSRKSTSRKAIKQPVRKLTPKPASRPGVWATIHQWAIALGKNEKTLQSLFTRAGLALPERGGLVSARDVFQALFGDEHAEKIRSLKLDNEEKERDALEAAGKLFPMEELEAWLVAHYIIPMSNIFAGMGAAIDTRCNPQQPEVARHAIDAYIESTVKSALKRGLEKPQKSKQ